MKYFYLLFALLILSCTAKRELKDTVKKGANYDMTYTTSFTKSVHLKKFNRLTKNKYKIIRKTNDYVIRFGDQYNSVKKVTFVPTDKFDEYLAYLERKRQERIRAEKERLRKIEEAKKARLEYIRKQKEAERLRRLKIKKEIENGTYTGYFVYEYNNGHVYEGNFVNGLKQGKGKYKWPNGAWYNGNWKNDLYHGKGEYRTSSGFRYIGTWVNDKRHGKFLVRKYTMLFGDSYRENIEYEHGKVIYESGNLIEQYTPPPTPCKVTNVNKDYTSSDKTYYNVILSNDRVISIYLYKGGWYISDFFISDGSKTRYETQQEIFEKILKDNCD